MFHYPLDDLDHVPHRSLRAARDTQAKTFCGRLIEAGAMRVTDHVSCPACRDAIQRRIDANASILREMPELGHLGTLAQAEIDRLGAVLARPTNDPA